MGNQSPTLRSLEPNLVGCLLESQDASGGWGEHKGGALSSFNTAEAVMALAVADRLDVENIQPAIRKAVAFLFKERDRRPLIPPDTGAWYRTARVHGEEHRAADIIRTAMVVGATCKAGEDLKCVESAVEWLIERQNNTGTDAGWGYRRGSETKILPTCFALLALIAASPVSGKSAARDAVERGLKHVVEKLRNKDGSFGSGPLTAAHTIYVCLVLQAARDRGFSTVAHVENAAIRWLLRNQDDALAPVEEMIEIDADAVTNYPFMFTMEALLLRVLANSQDDGHRRTRLWLDIQRSIHGAFDEYTGGFYGRRVFSWSTANGLYAIRCSEEKLGSIPGREPEADQPKGGIKVGHAIMGFALILAMFALYLTNAGKFGTLQAVFFFALVLACLVAYGSIGELTFKELISSWVSFKREPGKGE
jgi:prenyltransferase beta subunit